MSRIRHPGVAGVRTIVLNSKVKSCNHLSPRITRFQFVPQHPRKPDLRRDEI